MNTPDDLRYTAEHEWVKTLDAGDRLRVGITDFAQGALGDIVFVQLPDQGTEVEAGQAVGEIESTKSVSDVYAPVSGVVTARNAALDASPDLINSDPYGEGWMFELTVQAAADISSLLDAAAYEQQIESG
ncbi:MAG: glycine cleavage system protein GcvH [Actinomycetota bacterium]|nr:glycine cleavage system protein GcvH [Actinomycetota bacterium]